LDVHQLRVSRITFERVSTSHVSISHNPTQARQNTVYALA
jgi:hypothetical protein